jgi:outer membrane protein assembly factor BamB
MRHASAPLARITLVVLALSVPLGAQDARPVADTDTPSENSSAAVTDWPVWRGRNHDGVSAEKGWLAAWPKEGPRQLWKAELGSGYSSVTVSAGMAYGMGAFKGQDTVFCLNAETGELIWKHSHPCTVPEGYPGTRSTPTVDGKVVYTLSMDGQAFCLDAISGKVVWSRDLAKELGLDLPRHKFATSAVREEDLLLLNMGTGGLALDRKTGNPVWKSGGDSSYSSAVPFTLAGKRCAALFAWGQLLILEPATGRKVASFDWVTNYHENIADPLVTSEGIFITSDYGRGCAMVRLGEGGAAAVWQNKNLSSYFASPVLVGDCIYGLNVSGWMKDDLVCLSVKDGSVKWRQKDIAAGGLMAADGKLIVLSRSGELIVVQASPAAYTEIARAKVLSTGECSTAPVLSDGRIYVRNIKGTLVCLDVREKPTQQEAGK